MDGVACTEEQRPDRHVEHGADGQTMGKYDGLGVNDVRHDGVAELDRGHVERFPYATGKRLAAPEGRRKTNAVCFSTILGRVEAGVAQRRSASFPWYLLHGLVVMRIGVSCGPSQEGCAPSTKRRIARAH